jgi:biopolymer transport protein ExbD
MPKHKPKRHLPTIDMTAMVDVAFLLLTFFILTTKFRDEERQKLDLPFSTGNVAIKQDSTMLITVDTTERVFIGFGSPATRLAVLEKIVKHSHLPPISEAGKHHFSLVSTFGVPIQQLPAWLGNNKTEEQMKDFEQRGIPLGNQPGTNNDLVSWIAAARNVDLDMRFAIKGDDDVPMPTMELIIHSLQEKKANKFYLITNMQGGGQADQDKGKGAQGADGEKKPDAH